MLRNHLKIAWRSLQKNKLYSIVNIGGLAAGITCCLLICLYLSNELSYDRFHKNANRLARATTEYTVNGVVNRVGKTGSMVGPRFASVFPEIESFVRILSFEPYSVQYGEQTFVEKQFRFADSSFFQMFSFPLIEGDPKTALNAPFKLVITRSMERKYFGNEKALGKIVRVGGTRDYIVSGVAMDVPGNSQIQFDFVASFASLRNANSPTWNIEVYSTYFLVRPNTNILRLEENIISYMKQQKDLELTGNDYLIFHLEPITRVHLYSDLDGLEPNGNITYIYILAAITLLILCIASVNYTNLATAQAASRLPEIGIRKVMGSARWQIFWQFIGESLLLNGIAFILAVWLSWIMLPFFNRLVEKSLSFYSFFNLPTIGLLTLLFLLTSLASGAYPSFILSRLRLIKLLKTGFSFSGRTGFARRSLIVFQFAVSVFLIISTIIIFQQLSYIQHKNLGYDQEHVLVLPVDALVRNHYREVKEAIERIPQVSSVSCGAEEVTNIIWDDVLNTTADQSVPSVFVNASPTDLDFVKTLGLHIISGKDFDLADWKQLDSSLPASQWRTSYMLNESATKALGWTPEQAIGKILYRSGQRGEVKAVLKDFHFAPLHEAIRPLIVFLDSNYYHIYQMYVRTNGKDLSLALRNLETTWKERVPHRPFEFHFLDENYNRTYHNEKQTAKIFTAFSSLAILLACLGLFALAAYTTVQRAKEIGIRKVLGASALAIVKLLSIDFIQLVLLASLIAFPIAWFSVRSWLQDFAYRIDISWWVFVLAGVTAALIALGSITFQALRAAAMNPVESLRNE